jgi:putative serine protease PepD
VPGAAAAKAGIAEGDIVTNLDGEAMTGSRQLVSALRLHRVGDTVTVGILRDGEAIEIKVVLEKRPASR